MTRSPCYRVGMMKHELRRGTCVKFYRSVDDDHTVQGGIVALTFEGSFPSYSIVSHAEEDDGRVFEHVLDGWITHVIDESTAYDEES